MSAMRSYAQGKEYSSVSGILEMEVQFLEIKKWSFIFGPIKCSDRLANNVVQCSRLLMISRMGNLASHVKH